MRVVKISNPEWVEMKRVELSKTVPRNKLMPVLVTLRNERTDEIGAVLQIPIMDALQGPNDLAILLRCFGFDGNFYGNSDNPEAFRACLKVVCEMEKLFLPED